MYPAPVHPYQPGTPERPPQHPGLRAVAKARAARTRNRLAILATTVVSVAAVTALLVMFGLRPAPPGSTLPQPVTADLGASPSAAPATPAAPLVVVLRGNTVVLEGTVVATTDAITESGRLHKVDGLYSALQQHHFDHPGQRPPVLLDVARDTPAIVVKSVFQTAAFAGYTDIQFAALRADAAAP